MHLGVVLASVLVGVAVATGVTAGTGGEAAVPAEAEAPAEEAAAPADEAAAVEPELERHDYCVIGAGPGGLQLGALLEQSKRDYVLLEKKQAVGSFFDDMPRHGKLISINKRFTGRNDTEFNMRHDWNSLLGGADPSSPLMRDFSKKFWPRKEEFVKYLRAYHEHHNVKVRFGVDVKGVKRVQNPLAHIGDAAGKGIQVHSPPGLAGNYIIHPATFGPAFPTEGIKANAHFDGGKNELGCDEWPEDGPGSVQGMIAVVMRGGCSFVAKAQRAQDGGALAIIVVDTKAGSLLMHASDHEVAQAAKLTIPACSVDQVLHRVFKFTYLGSEGTSMSMTVRNIDHDKVPRVFSLSGADGAPFMRCNYLVLATSFATPYIPSGVEGIEHAEGYETVSNDPANYTDQRILVLGLGNAAFETATMASETAGYVHLLGRSEGGLKLASRTHYVGDVRAVNLGPTDMFLLKSLDTIDVNFDLRDGILRKNEDGTISMLDRATGKAKNHNYRDPYDRVIRCLGWRSDMGSMFQGDAPAMLGDYEKKVGKFPNMTSVFESVNIPNLFFAGVLAHSRDFKRSAGGFVHGFRYTARALHRSLMQTNHGEAWPSAQVGRTPQAIAEAIMRRAQRSSGLYQMFGELTDAIVLRQGKQSALYMEELPLAYFERTPSQGLDGAFSLRLDYGHAAPGGYADHSIVTVAPGQAHRSQFLHPIIRYYSPGKPVTGKYNDAPSGAAKSPLLGPSLVNEFHIVEDFLTTWDAPEAHLQPLVDFVKRCFDGDFTSQEDMLKRFVDASVDKAAAGGMAQGKRVLLDDDYYGKVHAQVPEAEAAPAAARDGGVTPDFSSTSTGGMAASAHAEEL